MSTTVKVVLIIVVLALIGGGAYLVFGGNTKDTSNNIANTSQSQSSNQNTDQTVTASIIYSSNSFSPSTTTVKSGGTIKITNQSSDTLQMQSDPHPEHTDDSDLNVGTVNSGQSKIFTVNKTGTFGFHNHLDPTVKGTIIVQ